MKRRERKTAEEPTQKPATDSERTASRRPLWPREYEDPIDDTLADSFPASDPPSWMGGSIREA